MKFLNAFICGMREFRLSVTTNFGDYDQAYEHGREWAHRLTLRRFDR